MIIVKQRQTKPESIQKMYPGAVVIDVTSKSKSEYIKFSPRYPHWGIPVPFSPEYKATSVETIWQGLKVFEKAGIDVSLFFNDSMSGIERSTLKFGELLGFKQGVMGSNYRLLDSVAARKQIFVPAYRWVLENKLGSQLEDLKKIATQNTVVLLDETTNADIEDTQSALSHASLIKAYLEGKYPVFPRIEEQQAFCVGQWVVHPQKGPGEVIKIDGYRAMVRFGSEVKSYDQYGEALKPITCDEPYTIPAISHGESATLCMDDTGRWGVVANPDKKQEAIPCEYEEVQFYAARLVFRQKTRIYYFLVKKDGRWGVLNKQGKQQAPCVYDELSPKESEGLFGGFEFRMGGRTGLINGKGEKI